MVQWCKSVFDVFDTGFKETSILPISGFSASEYVGESGEKQSSGKKNLNTFYSFLSKNHWVLKFGGRVIL